MQFVQKGYFRILAIICFTCCAMAAFSQSVKGRVSDAVTGEPMTGAAVLVKETGKSQLVELDGRFSFKNLAAGTYHLQISSINYKTFEQ